MLRWVDGMPRSPIHFAGQGASFGNLPAPYLELVYVTEGSIDTMEMGNVRTSLHAGQVGLLNVHFGNVAIAHDNFKCLCIFLDVADEPRFDILRQAPLALTAEAAGPARVERAFVRLIERCRGLQWTREKYLPQPWLRPGEHDPVRQALLKAALLELLCTLREQTRQLSAIGPSAALPEPLIAALNLLHRQYAQPLDLPQLAAAACLHPAHFGRLFKHHLGTPPMRYLMRFRIKQACMLLQDGSERINSVANEVGFADPFHFSRAFRQVMHCSPRAWRDQRQ